MDSGEQKKDGDGGIGDWGINRGTAWGGRWGSPTRIGSDPNSRTYQILMPTVPPGRRARRH